MRTSISGAATALALTALAGGAHAQLLGGAAGMVGGTARSAASTLGGLTSATRASASQAFTDSRSATGELRGIGDSVRSDVASLRARTTDATGELAGKVRGAQGELARGHEVTAATSGQTDLIAGDMHAVFRDYAGLNGRTTALETRGLTDHATDTARMAVRKVHGRAGDVVEITHQRAGESAVPVEDARDDVTDRARATTRHASGATRSDIRRVVAAAHDLRGQAPDVRPAAERVVAAAHALRPQPLPGARAQASGSTRLTVASTNVTAKGKARVNTRTHRATVSATTAADMD